MLLGLAYPLADDRRGAGAVRPNKADGSQIERDGKTVGSRRDRPGLQGSPALLPVAPVGDRLRPRRHLLQQPRSEQRRAARACSGQERCAPTSSASGRSARACGAPTCRRTRSRPRPPASTRTSPRPTRTSRPTAWREVRGLPLARVRELVDENTDGRGLGVFGEPGVNVLDAEPRARPGGRSMNRPRSLFGAAALREALLASLVKLDPRVQWRNPVMFVVEIGAVDHQRRLAQAGPRRRPAGGRRRAGLVHLHRGDLAVADGGLRQPRRSARRGARQGPGRDAARDAHRDRRAPARRRREAGLGAAARRRRGRRGRRADPRRRDRDRGHRLGRRVRGHRRVGAGDPRVRRRPQRGHRRHARAQRPDRGRDHPGAGPELPRPHDRAGRGRRAAQDAERDRARDPARRPDADLPRGGRDAAAVRRLRRHRACRSRR